MTREDRGDFFISSIGGTVTPIYSVTYNWTADLARRLTWAVLRERYFGTFVFMIFAISLAIPCAFSAELRWVSGCLTGIVVAYGGVFAATLRGAKRRSALPGGTSVGVSISQDGIVVTRPFTRSEMEWNAFARVIATDSDIVLVLRDGDQRLPVPRTLLPTEAIAYIQENIGRR